MRLCEDNAGSVIARCKEIIVGYLGPQMGGNLQGHSLITKCASLVYMAEELRYPIQ